MNDINFENMSNDDAVRVLRDIVHKPGWAARLAEGFFFFLTRLKSHLTISHLRPITLTVAKCWDPNPRSCFALPRSELKPVYFHPNCNSCIDIFTYITRPPILLSRWAYPAYRPSSVGFPHGSHDRRLPPIWHEPVYEHRHLHQLLHQQLYPRDRTWVTSPPRVRQHISLYLLVNCWVKLLSVSDSEQQTVDTRH